MDYETADGSQFSLREVWSGRESDAEFGGTLITAFVDGDAYAGRSPRRMDELDDVEVIEYLKPVPSENIFPAFPKGFMTAPPFDASAHYWKAPQFTYEDSLPGHTFVADCLLAEARILELLNRNPHLSIAVYYGCVVKDSRITHLCLKRYSCTLTEYMTIGRTLRERQTLLQDIREGIAHLHSLGLAHNDITTDNVCVDEVGHAVLVDFDACTAFGEQLMKGSWGKDGSVLLSDPQNDIRGLEEIENFLFPPEEVQMSKKIRQQHGNLTMEPSE